MRFLAPRDDYFELPRSNADQSCVIGEHESMANRFIQGLCNRAPFIRKQLFKKEIAVILSPMLQVGQCIARACDQRGSNVISPICLLDDAIEVTNYIATNLLKS